MAQVEMARQKIKQLMHEQERAADYEDRLTRRDGQKSTGWRRDIDRMSAVIV
jgi:hypothetical protein